MLNTHSGAWEDWAYAQLYKATCFACLTLKNLLGLPSCQSLSALKLKAINRAGRSCSYCVIQLSSVHPPAPALPEQHFQLLRAQRGLCLMIHQELLLKNHLPVKMRFKRHNLQFSLHNTGVHTRRKQHAINLVFDCFMSFRCNPVYKKPGWGTSSSPAGSKCPYPV